MEKGQLIITKELSSDSLVRLYVNPWQEGMKKTNPQKMKWQPYEGIDFLLVPEGVRGYAQLIDNSGRNITTRAKEIKSKWWYNYIPITQKQIEKSAKQRSSLFKKADQSVDLNKLFCKMPQPQDKFQRIIENTFLLMQENKDKVEEDESFGTPLINTVFENSRKAYVALDMFKDIENLKLIETYDIEWTDKFNFSNLAFLLEHQDTEMAFTPKFYMSLAGVCVYEGMLYFAKTKLVFPTDYFVRKDKTYMESALVDKNNIWNYIKDSLNLLK